MKNRYCLEAFSSLEMASEDILSLTGSPTVFSAFPIPSSGPAGLFYSQTPPHPLTFLWDLFLAASFLLVQSQMKEEFLPDWPAVVGLCSLLYLLSMYDCMTSTSFLKIRNVYLFTLVSPTLHPM